MQSPRSGSTTQAMSQTPTHFDGTESAMPDLGAALVVSGVVAVILGPTIMLFQPWRKNR
jgi:hypothetical protein